MEPTTDITAQPETHVVTETDLSIGPVKSGDSEIKALPDDSLPPSVVISAECWDVDDFTTFVNKSDFDSQLEAPYNQDLQTALQKERCYENIITLKSKGMLEGTVRGRSAICCCFTGKWVSITMRSEKEDRHLTPSATVSVAEKEVGNEPARSEASVNKPPPESSSVSAPALLKNAPSEDPFNGYLTDVETISERLYKQTLKVGGDRSHPQGVLIICGSTGCAKSKIVTRIIQKHIVKIKLEKGKRIRPHIVTFEDPIEKPLYATPQDGQNDGIDYTPRALNIDTKKARDTEAAGLKQALMLARRQTPSIFFIGEVREDEDWKDILNFAATGHLIIVTTHAGSIIDCFKKIYAVMKVKTAADRNQIADRILGVIHLRVGRLETKGDSKEINIPAIWRNTSAGISGMVSDGLASILPHNPKENPETTSALGRRWFARELLTAVKDKYAQFASSDENEENKEDLYNEARRALDKIATWWDQEGI